MTYTFGEDKQAIKSADKITYTFEDDAQGVKGVDKKTTYTLMRTYKESRVLTRRPLTL